MAHYTDNLSNITRLAQITEKLHLVFQEMNASSNIIDRISLALYDPGCDLLKTYIHCTRDGDPLNHYQSRLRDSASLQQIVNSGMPRIIPDISIFEPNNRVHSNKMRSQGFRSSYTYPIYDHEQFLGFIFINSCQLNAFTPQVQQAITPLIHLIAAFTIIEFAAIKTLTATVRTTLEMSHHRDPETGAHLERMARYSRLIALQLATPYQLSDEAIEHIFLFAPLHDVGKIAIPDHILLKPAKLTPAEFELMQTHTTKGLDIVSRTLANYQLEQMQHIAILKNIVKSHHEKMDGSGYPDGLRGEEIPIEARIVAVADIFDALTSKRPYKEAWSTDVAFAELQRLSGKGLDPQCVEAMLSLRPAIEQIQSRFMDEELPRY